jgi:ATP-dependent Clp protease ATP-binding subunit ClpB
MEITSKPTALDEINRSVLKLEMERLSLMNDTDKASKDRLSRLDTELSLLKKKQAELTEQWEHEKSVMTCIQSIKEEVYFHHEYLSEVKLSLQHILDNSEDSSVAHCHTY